MDNEQVTNTADIIRARFGFNLPGFKVATDSTTGYELFIAPNGDMIRYELFNTYTVCINGKFLPDRFGGFKNALHALVRTPR